MSGDLLRLVDSIHRDKDIDKELIFDALEDALLSAARKHYGPKADMAVFVDRESGQIEAFDGNEQVDATHLGRIAAQSAKQVIIQRIREAEQDSLFREYEDRVGQIVSGTVQRREGPNIIVNLGRAEGILPRSEQSREEDYRIGDRIRCFLLEVRREGSQVRIVLSRAHPDIIRRLFELEVPEISERVIEIMAVAREPGHRAKVAVASADSKVDCVGACVGVRGSRIKNIVAELNDEKIDIVRWSDAREILIGNSLKPAEIREVVVVNELNRARVTVPEEELSLAIGKRGRNVRLAAKLCDVDIDILSEAEAEREYEEILFAFKEMEGLPERFSQRVFQMGYSVQDIAEGAIGWNERLDVDDETVAAIVQRAKEAAEEIAAARAEEEARAEAEAAAEKAAEAETPEGQPPEEEAPEAAETEGTEQQAPAEPGEPAEPSAETETPPEDQEQPEPAAENPPAAEEEQAPEPAPAEEAPDGEPAGEEPQAAESASEQPAEESEPPEAKEPKAAGDAATDEEQSPS